MSEPDRAGTTSARVDLGARVLDALLEQPGFAAAHELPRLVAELSATVGALDVTIHLVDLQQATLTPLTGPTGQGPPPAPLSIDTTVAGRVYQHGEVIVQPGAEAGADAGPQAGPDPGHPATVWLPLRDGANRLGVLSAVVEDADDVATPQSQLCVWLRGLAAVVSHHLALRTHYGDSIVIATRSAEVGLAAEIQWGLLPPLTFTSPQVAIAAVLEPAYDVAGDSVDYAVDREVARVAIFDGMGHGLRSAQLASLSVAAYRNARRGGHGLVHTASAIDQVVEEGFGGEAYTTAVLAELSTDTGHLAWVNAGHPEPLLLRRGQLVRSLEAEPGLPFGLGLPDTGHHYPVGTEQLEPGDRVLFYTDGVVEGRSSSGDQFGVEQLVDLLARNVADNLSAAESMRRVARALVAHHDAHLTDDATILLLQWPGPDAGEV